jgi:YVTN family beta-propeller protein
MDELNYNQKSYVWYWTERDGQNGHDFVIRNPGGAWMEDCIDWCDNIGPYPDLNYHLRGYRSLPYKGKVSTGEVYDIAEHGSQPLVYVSVPESDIVRVINVDTESIIESIPVGSEPKGLAISPDSTKLYVALYGGNAIDVIDTLTITVTDTLVLTDSPSDLVYGGPGRLYAYLTHRIRSLDPDTD